MKNCLLRFLFALAVLGMATLCAQTVSDVTFAQRYPWNGLVDIQFTLAGNFSAQREYSVALTGYDQDRNESVELRTLTGQTSGFTAPGTYHVVWDAAADYPEYASSSFQVQVTLFDDSEEDGATYLVIDLSGGSEAERYPYRYTDEAPNLSDDTCRTTELWLRRIPAGTFLMGSPEDELGRPNSDDWANEIQHRVTLTQDYYLGVFECTACQWSLVMGGDNRDTVPATSISYYSLRGQDDNATVGWPQYGYAVQSESFMGVLRRKTGLCFDLPTEAQWEYACRAGTTTALNSGKNLTNINECPNMSEVGRYGYNGSGRSGGVAEVGSYLPNSWNLYDMHGNAMEWCLDWGASYENADEAVDPTGPQESDTGERSCRSGWWGDYWNRRAKYCRSASRARVTPTANFSDGCHCPELVGFRIACLDVTGSGNATTLVVTTAQDIVDDNDGAVSFREAIAQANETANARIVFNIPQTDILSIEREVHLEAGVSVNGLNLATGNNIIVNSSRFQLYIAIGSHVSNFHIKNTSSRPRDGGDIKLEGGTAANLHASENGDIHLWNNNDSKVINTYVEAGGQLNVEDGATAETVTVYHGGVFSYMDATFGGKLVIGGVAIPRSASLNNDASLLVEHAEIELDLTEWSPGETFHGTYLTGKSGFIQKDCPQLIENYRHFSGAASYAVRVREDQEPGVYRLMGNAGTFSRRVNLVLGTETIHDALEVGREYVNDGRSYSLSITDGNVLQLMIADNQAIYLVIDLSAGANAASYPYRYTDEAPDLSDDTCRTTELWLRHIPAGTFVMGSPEDELGRDSGETQHQVTLTQDYYIGVFEVTQKQYELVMGSNPSDYKGDTRPVEKVSYNDLRGTSAEGGAGWPAKGHAVDAVSFFGKLRAKTGLLLDLPTEAQWEYACRAGTTTALNSGKNLTATDHQCPNMAQVGRYSYNKSDGKGGYGEHTKVGSYLPNAWGLYDMHGNVYEWCLDWHNSSYGTAAVTDPAGPAAGSYRVLRGGSWGSSARVCRSANRFNYVYPPNSYNSLGFRVACWPLVR